MNHEQQVAEGDVAIFNVAALDAEHAAKFTKEWLAQHEDGRVVEFDTDVEACQYQRQHRERIGLDPTTGEPRKQDISRVVPMEMVDVPIDGIIAAQRRSDGTFPSELVSQLASLANEMRMSGQGKDIVVGQQANGRYWLLSGEGRFFANELNGEKEISVVVNLAWQPPALPTFEVTAAGFNGGSDDTDDRVFWIKAQSADEVKAAIEGTGAAFFGVVDGVSGAIGIDFWLPADRQTLRQQLERFQRVEHTEVGSA